MDGIYPHHSVIPNPMISNLIEIAVIVFSRP